MIKCQDVLVLLSLFSAKRRRTVRQIGKELDLDAATIHRSLIRLVAAGLVDAEQQTLRRAKAEEFLVSAVKYMFPAALGGPVRGIPTAWGASPLVDALGPSQTPCPVWPEANGQVRGPALEPLHRKAVTVAAGNPEMAKILALIDVLRIDDPRTRTLAKGLLLEQLGDAE